MTWSSSGLWAYHMPKKTIEENRRRMDARKPVACHGKPLVPEETVWICQKVSCSAFVSKSRMSGGVEL